MERELKSCPFCGKQPRISEAGHWAEVVISCNCHAVPQVVQRCVTVPNDDGKTFHYDNERAKKEAIDIWNTRSQDQRIEELENVLKYLFSSCQNLLPFKGSIKIYDSIENANKLYDSMLKAEQALSGGKK